MARQIGLYGRPTRYIYHEENIAQGQKLKERARVHTKIKKRWSGRQPEWPLERVSPVITSPSRGLEFNEQKTSKKKELAHSWFPWC